MPRRPQPVADYAKYVQQLAHLSRVIDVDAERPDAWKKSTKRAINRLIRDLSSDGKAARTGMKKRDSAQQS